MRGVKMSNGLNKFTDEEQQQIDRIVGKLAPTTDAVKLDFARALIERWRRAAELHGMQSYGAQLAFNACADELAATIGKTNAAG